MNVRELALSVLDRIEKSKSYSNIAIDTVLKQHDLSSKDRALFCRLVYGVIERKLTLDYLIARLSDMPMDKIELSVLNILRMGLYQLRFLDRIPAHAALNETVALSSKRSRGFVNALLRNYQRQRDELLLPTKEQDILQYLSVTYSYPEPLCKKLIEQYGTSETEAMLGAFNRIPPMTVRTNTLKISRTELLESFAEKGLEASPTKNAPHGIRMGNASPSDIQLDSGLCFVQDEASQIATAVLDAKPGDTVYDICACPGSKSFGAALTMQNTGSITCFDIHENKLSLVRSSAEKLGITIIKTEARDGRNYSEALSEQADKVICDVPCSGFGVVAKKPEIRYKDVKSATSLRDIQYDILNNACRYVKKGGTLVYSTCTVFAEENEDNVKRFVAAHSDFSLVPFTVGDVHAPHGMLTLLPHIHDTDGFFIAKLQRKDIP
jgi:16S rRNA (cytosine967-C5)-methyltransferase